MVRSKTDHLATRQLDLSGMQMVTVLKCFVKIRAYGLNIFTKHIVNKVQPERTNGIKRKKRIKSQDFCSVMRLERKKEKQNKNAVKIVF